MLVDVEACIDLDALVDVRIDGDVLAEVLVDLLVNWAVSPGPTPSWLPDSPDLRVSNASVTRRAGKHLPTLAITAVGSATPSPRPSPP